MKEVVSCERMKQLDAYTIEKRGIPSCVLMETGCSENCGRNGKGVS